MAEAYFEQLPEWQVAVCRECRIAVWPDHVGKHLQGPHHRLPQTDAARIQDALYTWPGVAIYPTQFRLPRAIPQPITALPL